MDKSGSHVPWSVTATSHRGRLPSQAGKLFLYNGEGISDKQKRFTGLNYFLCFGLILLYCPLPLFPTVETVTGFIFEGSKITADGDCRITADGDCRHEIKRCLLLGRKVMTNLDSILKSRDITLPTKVQLVKAMVFLVVMCGCVRTGL